MSLILFPLGVIFCSVMFIMIMIIMVFTHFSSSIRFSSVGGTCLLRHFSSPFERHYQKIIVATCSFSCVREFINSDFSTNCKIYHTKLIVIMYFFDSVRLHPTRLLSASSKEDLESQITNNVCTVLEKLCLYSVAQLGGCKGCKCTPPQNRKKNSPSYFSKKEINKKR